MNLNFTVYESGGETPPSTSPRDKNVRAFFSGAPDGGQVSGPYTAVEAAQASIALLSRGDVLRAVIEDVV